MAVVTVRFSEVAKRTERNTTAQAQVDAAETTLGPIEEQIRDAISYFERSPEAYMKADDEGRREMNHTRWSRFYVDDHGDSSPYWRGQRPRFSTRGYQTGCVQS